MHSEMHCVALTLMEHATIRQSYHKKWPFLIPNISHYVQRVSCSISSESAGALCFFWCSVIVLRSMNHLLQYSGLFCCEDLSSWFLQKVDTLILNNTESLWCCYCLHCELQMLHITHYCLWWSTDLSNFEAQKRVWQSTFLLKSVIRINVISSSNEFFTDRNRKWLLC